MSTLNQKRTARKVKEVIEGGIAIDQKDILAFIGYSAGIQKNPKMVFESKGFKEALKSMGFSIVAADMTVAKILRTGKEENQIKASQEIYKRLGAYEQPESKGSTITNFTQIIINPPNGVANKPNTETISSVASTPES